MKTAIECIPCLITQGIKVSKNNNVSDEQREKLVKEILSKLSTEEFTNSTPPYLAKDIYNIIGRYVGNVDPYKDIKHTYNNLILGMESNLQTKIDIAENSFKAAVKLAVVGNIIDFGTNHAINDELIYKKIEESDTTDFATDNSERLYEKLKHAKKLLYLGDNCGEIVFDKLLIKEIKKTFPHVDITFAVRGSYVINDVTVDDAQQVGMDNIVTVIDNGDNAPGTIIENCSDTFVEEFNSADVIISKGQGNYETLNDANRGEIFFLFMTKCPLVTKELNVDMFSLMCKEIEEQI